MSVEHPLTWRKVNGRSPNDLISEFIYELIGQTKGRKTVSSHIQVLKCFLSRRKNRIEQRDYERRQAQAYRVADSGPPVLGGTPTSLTNFPNCSSLDELLINEESPLPRGYTTVTRTTHSLSLVNHFYRTECMDYLGSNRRFDFGSNRHTLRLFCDTAPADLIVPMRHALITMIEGYMPPLPKWPNLRTLQIELLPRNPGRPNVKDREWGMQTEELLACLGVTLAVRARITLEMRWAADCERFERAYVEHGRWIRVGADVEDCPPGRDEGFCRRRYEMHGSGDTSVEEKEMQKSFSAAIGQLSKNSPREEESRSHHLSETLGSTDYW